MPKHIGTIIHGALQVRYSPALLRCLALLFQFCWPVQRGQLFTMDYRRKQFASIRGTLSACTIPTPIECLVSLLKIELSAVTEAVASLIETGQLPGTLQGGEYVPGIFVESQRTAFDSFFRTNKHIRYEQLPRQQVKFCFIPCQQCRSKRLSFQYFS